MKKIALIACLALAAAVATAGDHPLATESGWFDLENCAFCKHMLDDPELLDHAGWDTYKIENGMMYITTVEPQYQASFDKAHAAMEQLGTDMSTGKVNPMQVHMCGSCAAFGELMMAGVKIENIDGDGADVTTVTSDDPALVARLHEYADRNNKEMAELAGGEHEHDHGHEH